MNIQAEIDAASPGATVVVPAGAGDIYMVDGVNAPIRLRDGVTLQIDATLKVIPNGTRRTSAVLIDHVSDATVVLNGQIVGDADGHANPNDDNGFGIAMLGAVNATIKGAGTITKCAGDGLYIDQACKNIKIGPITSIANKRQGMSVIDVDGLDVNGANLLNTGGLPPGAGVDFEPDDPTKQSIRNVKMRNCTITGNAGASVLIACPPSARSNIDIDRSNKMSSHPIDGTDGVVPFYAKWLHQVIQGYLFYPASIKL